MYTKKMSDAFHAIKAPENFGIMVLDAGDFITLKINPETLVDITPERGLEIKKYIEKVKKTFEKYGAVVYIVRDTLEKKK
jgi:hypothetical protein